MPIIEINNLAKEFKLGQLKSLKHTVLNALDHLRGREVEKPKPFKALDNVSFKVEPGEVLGIIGQNGAGKSTLLKMLARISTPTSGEVKVHGSVAPLIEVGTGLIGDLTGRENIFLNGSILGLSRAAIKRKFDEIVAFAELEEFIDTPIKRYSSGMAVRLGFSIATSMDADILIVDEVLAVGDLAFQRKCFDRMEDMIRRQGKTVLLVSHNIRQVERLCSRTILMDHGKILADGVPKEVCCLFYQRSDEKIKQTVENSSGVVANGRYETSGELELLSISLLDQSGGITDRVTYNDDVTVSLAYRTNVEMVNPRFGIGVHTTDFLYLATPHSEETFRETRLTPGVYEVQCKFRQFPFLPGVYSLRLGISAGELPSTIFYGENLFHFQVEGRDVMRNTLGTEGFIALDVEWGEISARSSTVTRTSISSVPVHDTI
jgi:lipopolysaccharide transport system ATP-binding protein